MVRDVGFVILAGGVGSRMRAGGNKVFVELADRPMLTFSLETALRNPRIARIALVVRPEDQRQVEDLATGIVVSHRISIVTGGASRFASEHHGVESLRADFVRGTIRTIAVHDGARPFLSPALLDAVLAGADSTGGAIAATAVQDSLYSLDEGGLISPDELAWAQTPQAFAARPLLKAHRRAFDDGFEAVDTSQVVERFSSQPVSVIPGEVANIKMTFHDDLTGAEAAATGLVDYFATTPIDPYWTA